MALFTVLDDVFLDLQSGGLHGLLSIGLPSLLAELNAWLDRIPGGWPDYGLSIGLALGVAGGLLTAWLSGGRAWLRHYILRFLLWRAGAIPWNYPKFLNDADRCVLLLKDGAGYAFVHRQFMDYFARLDATAPPGLSQQTPSSPTAGGSSSNIP